MTGTNKGGTVKKTAFVLLGLLAVAMSIAALTHFSNTGDPFDLLFTAGFAWWAFVAFRKVGRIPSRQKAPRAASAAAKPRPWER